MSCVHFFVVCFRHLCFRRVSLDLAMIPRGEFDKCEQAVWGRVAHDPARSFSTCRSLSHSRKYCKMMMNGDSAIDVAIGLRSLFAFFPFVEVHEVGFHVSPETIFEVSLGCWCYVFYRVTDDI